MDGVRRTFQISGSELVVLDRIDLDIKEGEFISIVGASGCGKSTLLKLIVGLDHPTSGQIKVGERVCDRALPGLRRRTSRRPETLSLADCVEGCGIRHHPQARCSRAPGN